MMTREECENKLLEKAKEMREIYRQYNNEDEYLSIAILGNYISVNNSYCHEGYSLPIVNAFIFLNEEEENDGN